MPGLYVAEEMADNRFKISGGAAGMKVSWQVTGTRQDAWANKNRIPVEEDKPEVERGVEWARDPETMRKRKDLRLSAERRSPGPPGPYRDRLRWRYT
jgi:hypothetical protein